MSNVKKRILLLYDVKGWAYYNRCMAIQKYCPNDFEITISNSYGTELSRQPYDVVVQLAYNYTKQVREHLTKGKYSRTILVSSFNVGYGYANDWFHGMMKYADYGIVNNREAWNKFGKLPNTINISNGVDRSVFVNKIPFERRRKKVLWCGSMFHRKTKNYDTIIKPLGEYLRKKSIHFDWRLTDSVGKNRLNPDQMCQWYNSGTVYVVASRTEGTPNPALEAASCGCTVVSTHVGNMPELIVHKSNGILCSTSLKSIQDGVDLALKDNIHLSNQMQISIQEWDWKIRSNEYFDFFREIIQKRDQKHGK